MAHTGEYHGNASCIGSIDHFLVANGTARLDNGDGAGRDHALKAVSEGEERVRRRDRPFCQCHCLTCSFGCVETLARRDTR